MELFLRMTANHPYVIIASTVFYVVWIVGGISCLLEFERTKGKENEKAAHVAAHRLMCESLGLGLGGLALFAVANHFKVHMLWPAAGSIVTFWLGLELHLAWKKRRTA